MNNRDPKLTALLFNECINAEDIDGMVSLMTDTHSLICYNEITSNNKESSRKVWLSFFKDVKNYKNNIERIESRDNIVIMAGTATCSNVESLNLNVLWSAIIENDKVSEWQVYEDTLENRKRLKIG
ncbi:hypothetical protein JW824_10400 [bacterium]|nr:hypothetical protein [bacterium]